MARPAVLGHADERLSRTLLRPLDQVGVALGVLGFLASVTPSLLPRPWAIQGWVSGASTTAAYAVGVGVSWVVQRMAVRRPALRRRRRTWYCLAVCGGVVIGVSLWLGDTWQQDVIRAVRMPSPGPYFPVAIVALTLGIFAGLVMLARLSRQAFDLLAQRAVKLVHPAVVHMVPIALVALVAVGVVSGRLMQGGVLIADASYATADGGTDPGVRPPTSPLRSGSAASSVPWSSLGRRGRAFVTGGPSVAAIAHLTGRPAMEPIRVYAGTRSADSFAAEAHLVLAELERTGAFDRALIAIGAPPGEGGLDEALTTPLEYMYGGDTAVAAMQYSYLPSWVSFMVDASRARQSFRTLFDTVRGHWSALPPAHRPRLVVFGMSLGALGAADSFSGVTDLMTRASGALFVGPPNGTMLWQRLTEERVAGSPERLPVYRDAQAVRFAASPANVRAPDGALLAPRVVFLQHPTDPVVWWTPDLIWREPDWLREPRGPGVVNATHWFPLITFCQLVGDEQIGANPPAGYGHHYGTAEIVTAWAAILHPPSWSDTDTNALVAQQPQGAVGGR